MNSIRETIRSFESRANLCKRLIPSRLHDLRKYKLTFVSLSNLSVLNFQVVCSCIRGHRRRRQLERPALAVFLSQYMFSRIPSGRPATRHATDREFLPILAAPTVGDERAGAALTGGGAGNRHHLFPEMKGVSRGAARGGALLRHWLRVGLSAGSCVMRDELAAGVPTLTAASSRRDQFASFLEMTRWSSVPQLARLERRRLFGGWRSTDTMTIDIRNTEKMT